MLRFARSIRSGGRVLDVACGAGRHARVLGQMGFEIVAVDRDGAALAGVAAHEKRLLDLEADPWPYRDGEFDGIVVTNYLHRPLVARLLESLAPDGVLIYETFAVGNALFGRPSNPAFLLAPGELLTLTHGLRVLAFEDGYVDEPRPAMVQRICALAPGHSAVASRLKL